MSVDVGKLKVLIIDDQKTMRSIIRRLLDKVGIWQVQDAASAKDVLVDQASPGAKSFDLIICDLYMEGMDGTAFIKVVRHGTPGISRKIPILVLTGEADEMVHDVVAQIGATGVLRKPISPEAMKEEIVKAMASVRA